MPLAVCSRTSEYFSQEHRLVLQQAVVVQPLTTEQIDDYLKMAGSQLIALQTALQNNQVLRELAVSPLMLNILTLTYRDTSPSDLPVSGSVEEQRREVFARYVTRMLGTNKTVRSQQMLSWLTWLARQMQRHSQTEFYLEQLQPNWLSHERLIQIYELWAIRFPSVVMGACLSVTISEFFLFDFAFSNFILFSLLGGLLGGILSRGSISRLLAERGKRTGRFLWQSLLRWLSVGVFIGTGIGLSFGCSVLFLQVLLRTDGQASTSSTLPQKSKDLLLQRLMRRTTSYNAILVVLMVGLSSGLSSGPSSGLSHGLSFG